MVLGKITENIKKKNRREKHKRLLQSTEHSEQNSHITSPHLTSHDTTPHHITSHHTTSHNVTSHHIKSHHSTNERKKHIVTVLIMPWHFLQTTVVLLMTLQLNRFTAPVQ